MKIQNEIEIAAPPDELFEVLADPERVAPLFPGATLEATEDDDTYAGAVKLKIGPITASYQGTLRFVELDHENHRAMMEASGQETNGQGNAQATVVASVSGSNTHSVLKLDTDLEVRGKAAQFGRGALGNVSQRILDQFARNLEAQVLSGGEREKDAEEQGQKPPSEEKAPTTRAEASKESAPAGEESLDVLSVVGVPMLRQAAPAVAGLALGLLIGNLVASRKTLRAYEEAMRLMIYGQLYGPPHNRWWRRLRS